MLCFSWENILDMDDKRATELEEILESNEGTVDDRLQYDKYWFRKRLLNKKVTAYEERIGLMWEEHKNLPDALQFLTTHKGHIVNRLFEDNGVEVGQKLPDEPKVTFTLAEVKVAFTFHNKPTDMRKNLIKRMLETYFDIEKAYVPEVELKDGKWVPKRTAKGYKYQVSRTFKDMVTTCKELMIQEEGVCDFDFPEPALGTE